MLLQVVILDGEASGYSHGSMLLTIFVKIDYGHLPQGGVCDNKDSFYLYRAFVCLSVCFLGLQVPVHIYVLLESRSQSQIFFRCSSPCDLESLTGPTLASSSELADHLAPGIFLSLSSQC